MARKRNNILPGFGLADGFHPDLPQSLYSYSAERRFLEDGNRGLGQHCGRRVTSPRLIASYKLTLGASFLSALINAFLGLLVAWVLARYAFPGKRIVDAMVDLPFALPTAVAGLSLLLYMPQSDGSDRI